MRNMASIRLAVLVAVCGACTVSTLATDPDVLMQALADELERCGTLQLEGLDPPYFVQYQVNDRESVRVSATCGAVVASDTSRTRTLAAEVRVGSYELDNTNFSRGGGRGFAGRRGGGGGFGGITRLPIDDDYSAIRQAAWLATDTAYKSAAETYGQKVAYLADLTVEDRPADFARVEPVESVRPTVSLEADTQAWERRLCALSARFLAHAEVVDSQVTLVVQTDNRYLLNNEGTRIRDGAQGVALTITASAEAEDGEELSDQLSYHAATVAALPDDAQLTNAIDGMAQRIAQRIAASPLEDYIGPVLFSDRAAPQVFQAVLADGVAANPEPLGGGRRRFAGLRSLDKYLNKRILPSDFAVYDDPRTQTLDETYVAGHYVFDDEGVAAQRVDIVAGGRLKELLMSRAPTSTATASNGHGRSFGRGGARSAIGCLVVESSDGVSDADLKQALIDAARDQDLEYGIRVCSLSGAAGRAAAFTRAPRGGGRRSFGGGGGDAAVSPLGDPVLVYKVYLDGHEELTRGGEFGSFDVASLKDIIATGSAPVIYNVAAGARGGSTIVTPAVLFETLEIFTIDQDSQRRPFLKPPHQRSGS